MPPGTGDIIITICQSAPVSGAVIITTPHSLATIDVVKGKLFLPLNLEYFGFSRALLYMFYLFSIGRY